MDVLTIAIALTGSTVLSTAITLIANRDQTKANEDLLHEQADKTATEALTIVLASVERYNETLKTAIKEEYLPRIRTLEAANSQHEARLAECEAARTSLMAELGELRAEVRNGGPHL